MRVSLVPLVLVSVLMSTVAFADEQPPPPPVERPAEDDEEPDEAEREDTNDDDEGFELSPEEQLERSPEVETPPDGDDNAKPRKKKAAPPVDDTAGGFGAGPCWGSALGCGVLACVPGLGTSVGAVAGGVAGAVVDDRPLWPVVAGALPGLAVGVLGSAGLAWGLIELGNASGDYILPGTLLAISGAALLSAGPLTVAGITAADALASVPAGGRSDESIQAHDEAEGIVTAALPAALPAAPRPPMAY